MHTCGAGGSGGSAAAWGCQWPARRSRPHCTWWVDPLPIQPARAPKACSDGPVAKQKQVQGPAQAVPQQRPAQRQQQGPAALQESQPQ